MRYPGQDPSSREPTVEAAQRLRGPSEILGWAWEHL